MPTELEYRKTNIPVSSCQLVIDVSGGNAQREIYFIITPVCACYCGPCVLVGWGDGFTRRKPRTRNICRGYRYKKQCCGKMCTEKTACSPSFFPASPIPAPSRFPVQQELTWHAKGSVRLCTSGFSIFTNGNWLRKLIGSLFGAGVPTPNDPVELS